MNSSIKEAWVSGSGHGPDAYEAWVDKLMTAQGADWCPGKTPTGAFSASLRHKVIGEINVIESRCDPCTGYRTDRHAALVDEPTVVLLSYLEGGEHIEFGGERYTVAAGDTFVWDSSKATKFEVYESLHKVALAMPARLLSHTVLSALDRVPRKFGASSGSRHLLGNLIGAVADEEFDDAEVEAETILDAVNAFVMGALPIEVAPEKGLQAQQRQEIQRYVERHLSDPSLSIEHIALEHRVSKRYLHWLFRGEPMTLNEFIIFRRLERCRRELLNIKLAHLHVSQIAYTWGFANVYHFSKRYRALFNESPTETRRNLGARST
jgi:AraC-like DNA-binding protein